MKTFLTLKPKKIFVISRIFNDNKADNKIYIMQNQQEIIFNLYNSRCIEHENCQIHLLIDYIFEFHPFRC